MRVYCSHTISYHGLETKALEEWYLNGETMGQAESIWKYEFKTAPIMGQSATI